MCFPDQPDPPAPPPLPPPPPPPAPPVKPLPEPEPIEAREVNPQVRRTRSQKDKNPATKGTGALRIKLDQDINTGGSTGPAGGTNV